MRPPRKRVDDKNNQKCSNQVCVEAHFAIICKENENYIIYDWKTLNLPRNPQNDLQTIVYFLEIVGSHDYHYGVCIMGFIAQVFVKALVPLNKYVIEPMILTAVKRSIQPFRLP